jgi:opacity protein-like surface antigen
VKHATAFVFGLILPVAVMTTVIDGARAEGFADFRIGGAITQNTDGSATVGGVASPSGPIDFKSGVSLGIRGGYWLDSVPWLGFAFDLSYFDPDEDVSVLPVKLDVFPISALLMLRYPLLKSDAYPRGRLQPYAGVGPGAFVTHAKLKLTDVGAPENFSDTTVNLGLDVRGGVNFHFFGQSWPGESLAIFLEYRFTYFEPSDFKDDIGGVPIELELDELGTHHIVAGVGWYF